MYIIRAISEKDMEAFIKLAFQAGIGMTSMPKNREILLQKVSLAIDSFRKMVELPGKEYYLFVLEDLNTGKIVGSSGIEAKTGLSQPLMFYRLMHQTLPGLVSATPRTIPLLRVVHYFNAPSEICSLYLSPKHRREGLGKLLSLSRFLFIASHLHRFDPILFAEMRGFVDENNSSPFWEGIGRHFLDIRFETLLHIRDEEAIDLGKILPSYPIYVSLLPKKVQDSIGQVHPETLHALNMLIREGFRLTEELDLFDGGPRIEAETKEIRTVKISKIASLAALSDKEDADADNCLVSNDLLEFRACYGKVKECGEQAVSLCKETAEGLRLNIGDLVRYAPLGSVHE
jgi:arginine N-succinyltransferase